MLVKQDQLIYEENGIADRLFLIEQGEVKLVSSLLMAD